MANLHTTGHASLAAFHALFSTTGTPPHVLVTGGAGFIGRHLVARLLSLGARVTVLDDLSTGHYDENLFGPPVVFVQGDVLDPKAVAAAGEGVDLVMHLASVVGVRRAVSEPELAQRVSDEGTYNVLAGTGNAPVLLMSSSCVYGLTRSATSSETDPVSWASVLDYDAGIPGYACGKFLLEKRGQEARRDGRSVMIIRPFNIVGPGQRDTFGMVLPTFIRSARRGQALRVFDDGLQNRSFGDVTTFIDCLIQLLGCETAWTDSPINVGTSTMTAIRDLAEIVRQEINPHAPIDYQPYADIYPGKRDVRHRCPDTTLLERCLGPVAWRDINAVVRSMRNEA